MGSILSRRRSDGSNAYMAKIVLKRNGAVIHRETQTFDKKAEARAWMARRETEIEQRGLPTGDTLADAIDRYVADSLKEIGRTKAQVLRAIQRHQIAAMPCAAIRSQHLVQFTRDLCRGCQPQTAGNYLSHLAAVFAIAQPAWGMPLDPAEMEAARRVTKRLGLISASHRRDRRPTVEEMDALMDLFARRAPQAAPMDRLIAFAMFSTRRQEEIVRMRWRDLEQGRVLIRAMKHPGGTVGNDVWVDLPPEAERIARAMPVRGERVFPYSTDAVSAAFTRACHILGIDDLHFHDLRHEGISRLFEMGWTIPHVAAVSGHRSWQSLQRYTHVRQTGDRWAGWRWLEVVSVP